MPTLTLGLGLTQLHAEASSLLAIIPTVAAGTWRQQRYGNVRWRPAIVHRARSDRRGGGRRGRRRAPAGRPSPAPVRSADDRRRRTGGLAGPAAGYVPTGRVPRIPHNAGAVKGRLSLALGLVVACAAVAGVPPARRRSRRAPRPPRPGSRSRSSAPTRRSLARPSQASAPPDAAPPRRSLRVPGRRLGRLGRVDVRERDRRARADGTASVTTSLLGLSLFQGEITADAVQALGQLGRDRRRPRRFGADQPGRARCPRRRRRRTRGSRWPTGATRCCSRSRRRRAARPRRRGGARSPRWSSTSTPTTGA